MTASMAHAVAHMAAAWNEGSRHRWSGNITRRSANDCADWSANDCTCACADNAITQTLLRD